MVGAAAGEKSLPRVFRRVGVAGTYTRGVFLGLGKLGTVVFPASVQEFMQPHKIKCLDHDKIFASGFLDYEKLLSSA